MSFTVSNITSNVQRIYPDISSAMVTTLGTQIRRELYSLFPLLRDTVDITLVVGQREYALNADMLSVERVEHHTSSSAFTVLRPTDVDFLNDITRDWSTTASGTPEKYYLTTGDGTNGPMIGVDPAPDTATSGTYPKLVVYGNVVTAFSGTIYDDIPNTRVYETGIAALFAEAEDPANFEGRYSLYQSELERVSNYLASKDRHTPSSIKK